tara:strand:- start:292 stop:399 length:108 start_codon:yes stop_codon:yes gene_type:complete
MKNVIYLGVQIQEPFFQNELPGFETPKEWKGKSQK